jgi:hypothetical protein
MLHCVKLCKNKKIHLHGFTQFCKKYNFYFKDVGGGLFEVSIRVAHCAKKLWSALQLI